MDRELVAMVAGMLADMEEAASSRGCGETYSESAERLIQVILAHGASSSSAAMSSASDANGVMSPPSATISESL